MKGARRPTSSRDDARKRALRLLAAEPRTVAELKERLGQAGVAHSDSEAVVEEMSRAGYLDDTAYAEGRASSLLANGKNGPRQVGAKLRAKGVSTEIAERAVKEAVSGTSQEELAKTALAGRDYGPKATEKANARAARFLLRRGFSGAVVARLLQLPDDVDLAED